MSEDFFDGIGGAGAPSALLKNPGDYAYGEILDMHRKPYIPFGKKEVEKRDDGTDKQELVIVLQTEFRNWQGVNSVPVQDPTVENSPLKDPSEDDGRRAVYVPEGKNIQFAIGRALTNAKAKIAVGGTLGVKVTGLRDTGKGNPLKEHEATYQAPSAGGGFFPPAQQSAPAAPPAAPPAPPVQQTPPPAPAAPAAPAGDPWATPAPAPAQGDPWATPAPAQSSTSAPSAPPF